jgi:hypothetical protein
MQPCIGTAARYLNAYSLGQSQNIYEHQRNCSDKRVLNLTRSGFTGQHRYSTFVWSGDISSRWDVLAAQIPACLNYCITGSPYWTVDIGGFFPGSIPILSMQKVIFPKEFTILVFKNYILDGSNLVVFFLCLDLMGLVLPEKYGDLVSPAQYFMMSW